jgi:hypothetical protein
MAGLYYEPRSLWSIANVDAHAAPVQLELPRRHFYNGERHPITLKRIALCAVNYLLQGTPTDVSGVGYNETSAVLNRARLKISSPQQFHWNDRKFIDCASMAPKPTAQPPNDLIAGDAGEVATYLPSSMWGQSMLRLDNPLIVPKQGSLEWDLSAHTPFPGVGVSGVAEDALATAWMLYQQQGGLWPGSARQCLRNLFPFTGNITEFNPEERWPYPPDGYGVGTPVVIPTSDSWWPPLSRFPSGSSSNPNSFIGQNDARDGSSMITDLRVAIDQRLYDQRLVAQFGASARPSPLALRTGTRIRTIGTGSQTYWWRPGAPLALVFDAITPALVMDLPEPITLPPDGQLSVELEMDAVPTDETPVYHIGVSFNGFATIEG